MMPDNQGRQAATAILRIVETTDLHMQVLPFDYFTGLPDHTRGLVQLADRITALKQADDALTLLCDNGDFLQGNPLSDLIAEKGSGAHKHPMMQAFADLGYDAIGLGNHEFNYGLPYLARTLADAPCPVVCANIDWGAGDALSAPYALLQRQITCGDGQERPICIGVLGLAPPQIAQWDQLVLGKSIGLQDMVDTAASTVPQMRAMGADIIVALAHTGLGANTHLKGMENALYPLAGNIGIDVLLGGHKHDVLATKISGTPTISAGALGSHLGLVTLTLVHDHAGWHVTGSTSCALPAQTTAAQSPVAQKITANFAPYHLRTLKRIALPVAQTMQTLHSYFAPVIPDLPSQILADALLAHAGAALPDLDLPLLAVVPPFRAGGYGGPDHYVDIPAGPISLAAISAIYPYADSPVIITRTGAQIADWLEQAVSGYCQIKAGKQDQMLLDSDFPAYLFDAIYGLTYQIDLAQPPRFDLLGNVRDARARRISALQWQGRPVTADDRFALVVNSYRAFGGGNFPPVAEDDILHSTSKSGRAILTDDLRQRGTISPMARAPWRFAPVPGARAVFASSPAAFTHLPDRIRHIGPAKHGFALYEINLDPLAP
jgi:2',3'-cyclic-nucleotide 2'-phosphodiesterase/3'-nucleotidase